MGGISTILGALASGYSDAALKQHEDSQKQELDQRKGIVSLLGSLANNADLDPAHRQWSFDNLLSILQAEPGKKVKLPDFKTLPAGSSPGRSQQQQMPPMVLPPPPPGGVMAGSPQMHTPAEREQISTMISSGQTDISPRSQKGLLRPGNIDITNRPIHQNSDGSISTLHSMSFNEGNGEILIPRVSDDGRMLSEQEAIDNYHRTGKFLGVFATPNDATAYSKQLWAHQESQFRQGKLAVPQVMGALPAGIPPPPPEMIPGGSSQVREASHVTPPGQLHFFNPEEQMRQKVSAAQAIGADVTPREMLGLPEAKPVDLNANARLVDPKSGKVIAEGASRPLTGNSIRFEYDPKAGGVIDHIQQKLLTPQEVEANPEAKQVFAQAKVAEATTEKRQEDKEQRTFARSLSLATEALNNSIQRGAVDDAKKAQEEARKAVNKSKEVFVGDEQRYNVMRKLLEDIKKNPANVGSFDAALLAFHMGMTVGQVKGMRTGQGLTELHRRARSISEDLDVGLGRWADGRGLSDDQRENFVQLADDKMKISKVTVDELQRQYGDAFNAYKTFVGDVSRGRVKMPSTAPGGGSGLPAGWQ